MKPFWPWLASAMLALGACSQDAAPPPRSAARTADDACGVGQAELWARGELPSQARFAGVRVGGLSGIDYRRRENDYLLISDDRGAHGGGRAYRASLDFGSGKRVAIRLLDALALRRADGRAFAGEHESGPGTDAESIRAAADGWVYWTNEASGENRSGPQLLRMRWRDGKSHPLALPPHLLPDRDRGTGPRDNRSFEGLWIGRGGEAWIGLEAPLLEDGAPPTLAEGSWTRIVRLPLGGKGGRDYLYPLEPIANQLPGRLADNGLSELMVLPGPRFLVLERSGSQQPDGGFRYTSRIFCAYSAGGVNAAEPVRLEKLLVADLNALGPFDNANFEGMTFGPRLADGRRSLVLVADNDFRDERPTILAVIALR